MSGVLRAPDGAFWRGRLHSFGHTGWSDPVVYAYDQLERLERIRSLLRSSPAADGAGAVDFGCGTGDFSRLLLDLGYRVWGYDPFVEPAIESPRFTAVGNLEQSGVPNGAAIALSITALDHVLDDDEFAGALEWVRARLAPNGRLIAVEYAVDDAEASRHPATGYQAFRTVSRWRTTLERSGLRVESIAPVAHPHHSPSAGYLAYRRDPVVRLVGSTPMRRLGAGREWLTRAARRALAGHPPSTHRAPSPLKLLLARPAL